MKPVRPSNYDLMRDRMETEFAKYDQQEMIRKFSLRHDADFLYLPFAGREYRIHRHNGRVEWYSDTAKAFVHADYNASLTIFDVLAWSKPDCHLAGRFVPVGDLPGTTKLIIAQRVASVCQADLILVMDGGRVAAQGTHEELMRTCDIYREVYESQQEGVNIGG